MKLFGKSLLIYIGLLMLITYAFALGDLIGNKQLTGDILKDILRSITYYFTDVIIYWWAVILAGGVVLAGLTALGYKIYSRITKK
ncbi:hypothetical protein [Pararcticibacter amylolyticus]|uniref:Uncharacterized protein n=1 Tax=Pararcticibacter amylolyticus TaxID=2173175 RepID=A0A2U2PIF8_9SPHI|nr:hypothetical protein [Pararcticibacter amylolyticus]PWG81171.1 hypothetical protein DDR33_07220 [Pararcticibacter amylolyticus]